MILTAGGKHKHIVGSKVVGNELKVEWLDSSGATWANLQSSSELAAIRKAAGDKLTKSRAETSKGAGKGAHE